MKKKKMITTPLKHFTNNPRQITKRAFMKLQETMQRYGDLSGIVHNLEDGELIGGNQRSEAAQFIGKTPVITESFDPPLEDGTVAVGYFEKNGRRFNYRAVRWNKETALEANLIANAGGGTWDVDQLANIAPEVLIKAGLDQDFLKDEKNVVHALVELFASLEPSTGIDHTLKRTKRTMPLDIIYTLQGADVTCCLAVQAGWLYGINSGSYRLCPYTHYLSGRHEVAFIDNNYFEYDHGKHLQAVKTFAPKYCTVRDVMNEEQCRLAGIKWYSLEQILDWAEELFEHAQNVIVIPKYDCIERIPEKFMLGYSIPTSHGGTLLPIDLFRSRRVHLLGGSWKDQLLYLDNLGDSVVSIDNNHVELIARRGQVEFGDGTTLSIKDIVPYFDINNPRYFSLAISFGACAKYIQDHYNGNIKAENGIKHT